MFGACSVPPLLPMHFPRLLSKRGNVLAGKERVPSFDIVFLGGEKEVPQLHRFFRSQMLKQNRKRVLDQRLVGTLGVDVVLSDGFHSVAQTEAEFSRSAFKLTDALKRIVVDLALWVQMESRSNELVEQWF
jgi:hypothetical protein